MPVVYMTVIGGYSQIEEQTATECLQKNIQGYSL
jgi:hypothetical protein